MTEPRDGADPARLSGGGVGELADLRDLLDAARADLPSERRMRELAARLGPLLDPPPDGSGGTGGAPPSAGETSPPHAAPRSAALGPLAAVAGLVVATGLLALLARSPSTGEPSAHSDAARSATTGMADPQPGSAAEIGADEPPGPPSAPSAASAARDTRPARPVVRAAPSAPSVASASASAPEPPAAASTPPEPPETEASLLGRAQAAVASSPARALALAEEHARTFPRGALAQEREVIQVAALVRLGRVAEARARAAAFASRFPRSAHVRRMEALVPGATAPSAESTSRTDSDQKR